MTVDTLSRLVEGADFATFRDVGLEFLRLKGFRDVSLTDGWSDGGTDIRFCSLPPSAAPIAVQLTVEKRWKPKLLADAAKVHSKLKIASIIFVTSRRIAESEFVVVQQRLLAEKGMTAIKYDNQVIASTFFGEGKSTHLVGLLARIIRESLKTIVAGPAFGPHLERC